MRAPVFLFLPFQFQRLGKFLPLAVLWHLQGGTLHLLQGVGGVVLLGESGNEVFRAVVVDEGEGSGLTLYPGRGDDPTEGVVVLTQITWQLPVEFLSRHFDIFVVEIDFQINVIFIID